MKNMLHVRLPDDARRAVQMRAAQLGRSVSEHIDHLIRLDAEKAGIASLVIEPGLIGQPAVSDSEEGDCD